VLPLVRVLAACLTACFTIAASSGVGTENEPVREHQLTTEAGNCDGARIRLVPNVRPSALGEPISLIFTMQNCSDSDLAVLSHSLWAAGELRIFFRANTENQWQFLRPILVRELRGHKEETLQPGESIAEIIPVYLDASGWVLSNPGVYEFQAGYLLDSRVVLSNIAKVIVSTPRNPNEVAIAQTVTSMELQRFLYYRGGPEDVERQLRHIVESTNNAPAAAAMRIAILLNQNARMPQGRKDTKFCSQVGELYSHWDTEIVDPRLAVDLSRLMADCDLQIQRRDLARNVWHTLIGHWPDLLNDWNVRDEANRVN